MLLADGIVPLLDATPVSTVDVLAELLALLPETAALVVPVCAADADKC